MATPWIWLAIAPAKRAPWNSRKSRCANAAYEPATRPRLRHPAHTAAIFFVPRVEISRAGLAKWSVQRASRRHGRAGLPRATRRARSSLRERRVATSPAPGMADEHAANAHYHPTTRGVVMR